LRRFYTVEEVARVLGVSVSTVRRRIRDGTIRSIRLGGVRRVHHSALEELGELPPRPTTRKLRLMR
jgi:excisionase family DNA binding protein